MSSLLLRVRFYSWLTPILLQRFILLGALSSLEQGEGYLFRSGSHSRNKKNERQTWHPDTCTHWFGKYAGKAGLTGYRLHSVRHTYSNYLRSKGVPIDIIARLLGHSSPMTTWDNYDDAASDALMFRQQADLVDFEEGGEGVES